MHSRIRQQRNFNSVVKSLVQQIREEWNEGAVRHEMNELPIFGETISKVKPRWRIWRGGSNLQESASAIEPDGAGEGGLAALMWGNR